MADFDSRLTATDPGVNAAFSRIARDRFAVIEFYRGLAKKYGQQRKVWRVTLASGETLFAKDEPAEIGMTDERRYPSFVFLNLYGGYVRVGIGHVVFYESIMRTAEQTGTHSYFAGTLKFLQVYVWPDEVEEVEDVIRRLHPIEGTERQGGEE